MRKDTNVFLDEIERKGVAKILVIGNGFDVAHELPTKYSDFLEFCSEVIERGDWETHSFEVEKIGMPTVDKNIKKSQIHEDLANGILQTIYKYLYNNIWYKYFEVIYKKKSMHGENWIDFESEISFIIEALDRFTPNLTTEFESFAQEVKKTKYFERREFLFQELESLDAKRVWTTDVKKTTLNYNVTKALKEKKIKEELESFERSHTDDFKKITFVEIIDLVFNLKKNRSFKDIKIKLYDDLQLFVYAFEVYLLNFVDRRSVDCKSPDIDALSADFILSFNYTGTHLDTGLYDFGLYDNAFVHGCVTTASVDNPEKYNSIVLGIGEYWTEEERDKHTNYTIFKKIGLRIQKGTNNDSYKFVQFLTELSVPTEIYIFGHSLDVTDKDILCDIFEIPKSKIVVFYHNKATEGEYIANIIKLITQKKLIKRMKEGTIEFRQQQDMVPVD